MNYYEEQPWIPFSEVQNDWELGFHNLMLSDKIRMHAYKKAIHEVVREGDLVVDLGTGTGILSLWALQAGAKKVYGIEMDPSILSLAVDRINNERCKGKFIPINKVSFDVVLPEKVDVLISEIIGNLGDNEGFQPILEDAHKRFLKTDCRTIPQSVSSYLVPVSAEKAHAKVANKEISTLNPNYDINALLETKKLKSVFNLYYDSIISIGSYLSTPQLIKNYCDQFQQTSVYSQYLNFRIERDGVFTGFKGYFIAQLSDITELDISRDNIARRTTSDSWKHAYLPVENKIEVKNEDTISMMFERKEPLNDGQFEHIYRWQGTVNRENSVIAKFDQSMDECFSC